MDTPNKLLRFSLNMTEVNLKVVLAAKNARIPTRGSDAAAGYDLFAATAACIPAGSRALISTGLRIGLPAGCYGRVASRSGLSVLHGIEVGAGVIDADYTGVLDVVLFNHNDMPYEVEIGDRIAQLICEKIEYPVIVVCQNLDATARGDAGCGSTGK